MIPIIIGAVAAASGIYGLVKGGKAVVDHRDASSINTSATRRADRAIANVKHYREQTHALLSDYGTRKLRAFNGAIGQFIEVFESIKDVDFDGATGLNNSLVPDEAAPMLIELRKDYEVLVNSGLGLGAGLGGGAALAFGAYNGTFMLATAGTGTAISTLSGAAATNATLAWLGGGTLSAGGFGMAGGMMVLGGIVAGPALAVCGMFMGAKAEIAVNQARENALHAEEFEKQAVIVITQLRAVADVTRLMNGTFSKVTSRLRAATQDMRMVIESEGSDFSAISEQGRGIIFRAVKLAQLTKAMIDTPILDEQGALVLSTSEKAAEFDKVLEEDRARQV